MDFNEVKAFISEHQDDAEVKTFLDSLADKRVSGALETAKRKWEAEIPGRIKDEVERLHAKEVENIELLRDAENKIKEAGGDLEIGMLLLGDLSELDEKTRAERIQTAVERSKAITGRLVTDTRNEIYGGDPPPAGGGEKSKMLEDMTSDEILQNLEYLQEAR